MTRFKCRTDSPLCAPAKLHHSRSPQPYFRILTALLCLLALPATAYIYKPTEERQPRVAIIIDDIGYNIPQGRRTAELKGNVTLAVLPLTPGAVSIANQAHASGKEIMLHAPMSNSNDYKLGPGGLTPDMDKETFLQVLSESLDAIPHIRGVNNHMGSELTTIKEPMQWLMEDLKRRNLYFIDSLTSNQSVALSTARRYGVISQQRDIFLDNIQEEAKIEAQFNKLIRVAKKNGYAIGIGHPYPSTLNVLEKVLPELEQQHVELVFVSQLLDLR
ncbi:putative protein [BD1-7 clade bacterium]|uniref:Divergent polysaccharide deacetylase n=1 Tax=BD1-7 clade bacterium TaxID=2029982 RepID=A0A5S9MY34_9GAMM|nr:putative protein [BD1-7 clade bacterium]